MAKASNAISLGVELDDERLTWGNVVGDQTVLGYDLVLIQIGGVLSTFRQGENLFDEREQVAGIVRPSDQARAAMERALHKRRRELDELLKQGGSLIVFMKTPEQYAVPGRVEERTDAATGQKTKVHMHEPRSTLEQVLPIDVSFESLWGHSFRLATTGPFAEFWTEWEEIFHHEAVIGDHVGTTAVEIPGTRKAVAAIVRKGAGTCPLGASVSRLPRPGEPGSRGRPKPRA
ncbi:MAG TPA: hypothetical protein VGO31_00390 [Microbacteriaceae bacterium]|jgi:hypothetical protein|nr:hypothetical protein [Microbacteriaceae bacterium]